jgi:hypothetical protein
MLMERAAALSQNLQIVLESGAPLGLVDLVFAHGHLIAPSVCRRERNGPARRSDRHQQGLPNRCRRMEQGLSRIGDSKSIVAAPHS